MLKIPEEMLNHHYDSACWEFLNEFTDALSVVGSEYADLSNMYDGCAFE